MKICIPIGGGSINNRSTNKIDKFILGLVDKISPRVLFIPTASGDNKDYIETFKTYYKELGATVATLILSNNPSKNEISGKIFNSDVIYIGGGNSARMMRIFKRFEVIDLLRRAYESGIILTGLSAGALCYFKNGYSDSNRSTDPNASFCKVNGLDIIPYSLCPHYNEQERKSFDEWLLTKEFDGLALEDDVALVYVNDKIQGLIKSNKNNKAYIITKDNKTEINTPVLYMLVGIPGSGKSSYCKATLIPNHKDAIFVASDKVRDANPDMDESKIWPEIYRQCSNALIEGNDLIFDATNVTKEYRKKFIDGMHRLGAINFESEAFCFITDSSKCIERVKLRNNDKNERYLPIEVITMYANTFEVPTCDEGFRKINIIDNNKNI